MNDVAAERGNVAGAERFGAGRLDAGFGAAPVDVVLAARVNADDGIHLVIVRHQAHAWGPGEIEDGQLGGSMQRRYAGLLWFAKLSHYARAVGDGGCDHLTHRLLAISLGSNALFNKAILVKHGADPR